MRNLNLVVLLTVSAAVRLGCHAQSVKATSVSYYPAYFRHIPTKLPRLTLFPIASPEVSVPLPKGLPADFRLIAFGSDGAAIYGQANDSRSRDGITKIEFQPVRQVIIPGSVGLSTIWNLAVLKLSGIIFVSGWSKTLGTGECGTFEIDPANGTFNIWRVGIFPDCGGGGGPISPDGKRVLRSPRSRENYLGMLDLATGIDQPIGAGMSGATWSPDGRWIAAIQRASGASSVVLVDATNTSHRRNLGRTDDSQAQWSPDSRYLLIARQGLQCGPELWSLEIIDVGTGKRIEVKSSHCKIFENGTGWLDPKVVQ